MTEVFAGQFSGEVTLEPAPLILIAELGALAAEFNDFKEPLTRAVEKVVVPSIQKNFDEGGRPTWEPLADATLLNRAFYGSGDQLLVRTGQLRDTATGLDIWQIDSDSATVPSLPEDVSYGEDLQAGTQHDPARPFLMIQSEDEDGIVLTMETWLLEAFALHGWNDGVLD